MKYSFLLLALVLTGCAPLSYRTDDYGRVDQGMAKNIQWGNNRLVLMSETELTPMKEQLDRIEKELDRLIDDCN